jgi:UDP-GlcNAc3NAcA epimerase
MMKLVKGAAVVATDSGGLQKEAFWLKVPCVTLRAETEWLELVEVGANVVCAPSDSEKIISTVLNSIGKRVSNRDLYGNGRASEKIAELIKKRFAPGLDR